MAKYEVSKSLEAVKLNQRTGIPLTEPAITIPYGAILDGLEEVGNYYKFTYLAQRYQMRIDAAKGAIHVIKETSADPAPSNPPASSEAVSAAVVSPPHIPENDSRPVLEFEPLRVVGGPSLYRAKVPGGWLVANTGGVAFVSDEYHSWDGGSHA